ncbi:MAG: aspartate dehydrogenase [Candidatus Bathycorpusculaceae bacterium]
MKKIVGIIGCGAIGTVIAKAIDNKIVDCDAVVLYDLIVEKAEKLGRLLSTETVIVKSVDEMIKLKPKVIVEAASQQAVKDYANKILDNNIHFIVLSVGALLDLNLKSNKIHIPSGAIGGLDAISSAALAGISEALLTTRKNPLSFGRSDKKEVTVYEGPAEEAVKKYPENINVAATLALAVQPAKLMVRIVSDPKVERNIHEIKIKWKHGEMLFKFINETHPENPKTSALAAWSAINLLKNILENIS